MPRRWKIRWQARHAETMKREKTEALALMGFLRRSVAAWTHENDPCQGWNRRQHPAFRGRRRGMPLRGVPSTPPSLERQAAVAHWAFSSHSMSARPDHSTPREQRAAITSAWLASVSPAERAAVELAGATMYEAGPDNFEMLGYVAESWDVVGPLWLSQVNPGSRYYVRLGGVGNPDMRQFADVAPRMVAWADTREAIAQIGRAYISAFELGGGNWAQTLIVEPAAGRASELFYNGRHGEEFEFTDSATPRRSQPGQRPIRDFGDPVSVVFAEPESLEAICECGDGCGWQGPFEDTLAIEDVILNPGHPSPAGRCPECEGIAYSLTEMTPAEKWLVDGLRGLADATADEQVREAIGRILKAASGASGAIRLALENPPAVPVPRADVRKARRVRSKV